MDLSVLEIAKACGGQLVIQNGGTQTADQTLVDSVVLDSRKVTAGGVFVATVGERVDGHKFIPQVFDAGAALVVTEKAPEQVEAECGVSAGDWGSYVLVESSFQALKDIAEYYRKKLTIPVVGITGSVGKTSTKQFVACVLAEKYHVFKTEGNYNNEVGVPLTLLSIRKEHEIAVVEMGISDFGEMHRLSKIVRPNVCVITNIGQCHLENLKTREGILRAKTEIFDYMAADGEICLNGEDDMLQKVTKVKRGACAEVENDPGEKTDAEGKAPYFFGLGGGPGQKVWASDIESKGLWGSDATLHIMGNTCDGKSGDGEEIFPVHIPLPGKHMVINAAAAACVANLFGLTAEQIASGLEKLQSVEGRSHLLRLPRYTVIDDCYNANPVSMKAAVDLLLNADTCTTAILGDMFELGEKENEMHAEVGAYAAEAGIDCILCVGEHSKYMWESAAKACSDTQKVLYFADRDSLLQTLDARRDELLPEGCTVLVKASHGMAFGKVVEHLTSL